MLDAFYVVVFVNGGTLTLEMRSERFRLPGRDCLFSVVVRLGPEMGS
jgi:hypothetical protein